MNTRWNPFVKQLVIIGTLIGAVWLLARTSAVLAPVILALLLAYLVSLLASWMQQRTGWSRTVVVALSEIVVVLLLLTVPAAIAPSLVNTLLGFMNNLIGIIQELLEATPKPIMLTPSLTIDLGLYYAPINQWLRSIIGPDLGAIQNLQNWLRPVATGAAGVLRGAVNGIVWLVLILVVSFYTVRDAPKLARWGATALPEAWRPELGRLWHELVGIWDAFVRGQLILGIIIGVTVWLIMSILGVRNAAALGLISGLLEFVPAIGPVLAAVPGVAFALFLGSSWLPFPNLWFAVLVALVYILIQQVENLYLLPRVVGSRVRLHPAVVIIGALAGAQLGGALGILLAAPAIAAGRVLLGYTFRKLVDAPPFPEPAVTPDRSLLWSDLVRRRAVSAILFDLDGTLIETDDHLVDSATRRTAFLERFLPEKKRAHVIRRVLMFSEVFVNRFMTLLDWLRLDGLVFRWGEQLQRIGGMQPRGHFVPVAGTPDVLRVLARRYHLGIVTSRSTQDAAAYLSQYGLSSHISVVVTRNDTRRLKPHPAPIRLAAARLGVAVAQCVMVGDTSVDVRAAKTAGALAIGVLCGFGTRDDFKEADLVLDSTEQIVTWL